MKIIFISLFLFFINYSLSVDVCFPQEFTTHQAIFEPLKHDFFLSRVWFSLKQQKERVDYDVIMENGKDIKERVSLLFDHANGKWYDIHYYLQNHTSSCQIHKLSGQLQQLCLSKNAVHRGSIILGGVLHCDNYIEHVQGHEGRIAIDALVVKDINVPVRVVVRNHEKGFFSVDEYYNFKDEVGHDAFLIPSFCKTTTETIENIDHQILSKVKLSTKLNLWK